MNKNRIVHLLIAAALIAGTVACSTDRVHVYEVVEESFTTDKTYDNPYMEVDLLIELRGPEGQIFRIPGFWDGGIDEVCLYD